MSLDHDTQRGYTGVSTLFHHVPVHPGVGSATYFQHSGQYLSDLIAVGEERDEGFLAMGWIRPVGFMPFGCGRAVEDPYTLALSQSVEN